MYKAFEDKKLQQIINTFFLLKSIEKLINLIENGLDSIRDKGSGGIQLKTCIQENKLHLEYSDTGNGIPEDIQDKIFEPYFSTKSSGMGLGMAIVKRIIDEHGGTIIL